MPTSEEREFVERVGLFLENLGAGRTMGRIYGWLMICEPRHQSITEVAEVLGLSKAMVSTVIRQLELAEMVERVPVAGSRQHYYRLLSGGWAQILRVRVARMRLGTGTVEYGLSVIGADRPDQRERLHELHDFIEFVAEEFGEPHVRRWEAYHARKQRERVRRTP